MFPTRVPAPESSLDFSHSDLGILPNQVDEVIFSEKYVTQRQ